MKTLILGIGNTLLTDEGVGVHVLDYLRNHLPEPEGVTYLDGGTLSFTLAAAVGDADILIVIDAAQLKQEPGTVDCKVDAEMDAFLGNCKRSVHEVGLLDLLDIARLTDNLPKRRALVAIQPGKVDWGEAPTDAVAQAIPLAAQQIIDLMTQWQVKPKGT